MWLRPAFRRRNLRARERWQRERVARTAGALFAEGTANEAVNVRKLLGSSPSLCRNLPWQSPRLGPWPSSRSP